MSETVATRQACFVESTTSTTTITAPTQLMLSGESPATVMLNGVAVGVLTPQNNTMDISVAGNYDIVISGKASTTDTVVLSDLLLGAAEIPAAPIINNISYCNTSTETQWMKVVSYVFDDFGVPTEIVLSDTDLGVPCVGPTPDIERLDVCVNGEKAVRWIKFVTDEFNVTTSVVLSETLLGVPCVCTPTISSFTADAPVLGDVTKISVSLPGCCDVTIATSAGDIIISRPNLGYSEEFCSPITITGVTVTGDCDASAVSFITKLET